MLKEITSFISLLFTLVPLTINGLSPQTISGLVPVAPNGYNIIPPNPKISLTSSGNLVTTILDYSDAGNYTITSPDFNGANVVITLIVQGKFYMFKICYNPSIRESICY